MTINELNHIWKLGISAGLKGEKITNPFNKQFDFEKWINFRIGYKNGLFMRNF